MPRRSSATAMPDVAGVDDPDQPLYLRLQARLRRVILDGNLTAGARVPASRRLAVEFGVSRNTVETAYAQLEAEGFLTRRPGSGTYVSEALPLREMPPLGVSPVEPVASPIPPPAGDGLSRRGRLLAAQATGEEPSTGRAFTPSFPALELFPRQLWARLIARNARAAGSEILAFGARAGLQRLREAIAAHVGATRAVRCTPDQVIVLTSAQQAIDLAARLLIDPGDQVWMEDPGYIAAAAALRAAGATLVPVPVDGEGIDVAAGIRLAPEARIAYVTPSRHYPTGAPLTLARRLALLSWAAGRGSWIIEDDYDSEFHFAGRPLASLQGLDEAGRVLYVGTFNKLMFPSLRLAYVVVPPALVQPVLAARFLVDGHTPVLSQAALADFILDGHLGTHLRRMREAYEERRDALLAAVEPLDGRLVLGPSDGGMNVAAYAPRIADDRAVAVLAARRGVELRPLSIYYAKTPRRASVPQGFMLGFACASPTEIRAAVQRLAPTLDN
ncbi:MAG TPA: PLP-dependent aminotransferase family protein [Stellaceae bacterium]|nr:PLP-dependent aminotransferase family protein [Stellaceae bacterium]